MQKKKKRPSPTGGLVKKRNNNLEKHTIKTSQLVMVYYDQQIRYITVGWLNVLEEPKVLNIAIIVKFRETMILVVRLLTKHSSSRIF